MQYNLSYHIKEKVFSMITLSINMFKLPTCYKKVNLPLDISVFYLDFM